AWKTLADGDVIAETDCRYITVVSVDKRNTVRQAAYYEYVPGVQYGPGNADQYDDPVYYKPENPSLEDDRAVRLASALFKSAKSSYYNADFGAVTQGFLSKYGPSAGLYAGYYHNGVDFSTQINRPFYAPISGKLLYAGAEDGYHTLIIYNEEKNLTLLILDGGDVTHAQELLKAGGSVNAGDLLGYGGGEGLPAGGRHLHIEVRVGRVGVYKSFSSDPSYTRMTCYDPLVLADMFSLSVLSKDMFDAFAPLGCDPFSAQNGACAVRVGSWLYYIDKTQGGAIFRSRPDGSDVARVTDHSAACLNVLDGWLYYSDLTDGGHLVKTLLDGSATVTLSLNNTSYFVLAAGEKVYFVDTKARNALYSCRTDGSDGRLLLARDISHLFYTAQGFYYAQNVQARSERIWFLNFETGESQQITDSRSARPFVYENLLCFSRNYSDRHALTIPPGVTDEEQGRTVIPAAYYEVQTGDRFLVFTNNNDANSLYLKFDERDDLFKLSSVPLCTNLTRVGDWLYFFAAVDTGNSLCRINLTTLLEQHLLADGWWTVESTADPALETLLAANRTRNSEALNGDLPTPTPVVTPEAIETPTAAPTEVPTEAPTEVPTAEPTEAPTPTEDPTETENPTEVPAETPAQESGT
ncbi:MAG: DUF5050 domain-containing protein, partial [Clostridia bacterium]|nr:DUF5050 domain-containing protein [Clostridia bacterium]